MNIRSALLQIAVASAVVGGLAACFRPPNYPDEPQISFESIINRPGNIGDTITVAIRYNDGNGDLGLGQGDTTGNFARLLPNGQPNPNRNNYFVTAFKRQRGTYTPIRFADPNFDLSSRFPRLVENNNGRALEGVLRYDIQFLYTFQGAFTPSLRRGDTVRFEVQIADRSLNRSNSITTEDVVIGTRK
ncbi:MAG: hypothetical protein MUC97_05460 [Bernardetiaceae bacterium]|jgi:hypothetical protein|nr:hypothetical protein [Bernardetiaceae bacterium]